MSRTGFRRLCSISVLVIGVGCSRGLLLDPPQRASDGDGFDTEGFPTDGDGDESREEGDAFATDDGDACGAECDPPGDTTVPACATETVIDTCVCGSVVVDSGYCCGGVPRDTPCPPAACINGQVSELCVCGSANVSSGYCCNRVSRSVPCASVPLLPGFRELALACSNATQDDFEDAVDCGGACPACSPPTGRPVIYLSASVGNDNWSGSLPEPNTGSTDGPWKTLEKLHGAWSSIGPGHFILLRRGDRWAPSALATSALIQPPQDKAGTEETPITLGAYGVGAPPILSTVSLSGKYAFYSSGLSYFQIEDIELRGTVAFSSSTSSGVHHVRFRRIIWDGGAPGDESGDNIHFFTPPYVETAPETWSINPLHDIELGFCLLQNNRSNDILNFSTPSGKIWIHHNELYNSLREALDFGGGDEITIEQNIISGGREANGVKIQPQVHTVDNLVVRGNLIVHVGVEAWHYPLVIYNARNAQIYDNTIIGNNLSSNGSPAAIFGWMPSAPVYFCGLGTWGFDNAQIHDNIFVGWLTFGVPEGAAITYANGTSITYTREPFWEHNFFTNNVFFNPKGSRAFQIVHYVPPTAVWYDPDAPGFYRNDVHATYEDITASEFSLEWSSNTNVSGDWYGDPLFVDPNWASPSSFGDYHLQAASPAAGRGCYPE